jgi:hypothetical protein
VLAAVLAGVFIGLLGRVSGHLPEAVNWATALGGPWLVTAFAVGAVVRNRVWSVLAGGAALTCGVGVYYSVFHWIQGSTSLHYAVVVGLAWGVVAFFAGGLFAYAGAAWRDGERWAHVTAAAALGGALLGEAFLLLAHWEDPTARLVLMCELMVGALVPVLSARRRELPAAVVLGLVFAVAVFAAEGYTRAALRTVGWAGA